MGSSATIVVGLIIYVISTTLISVFMMTRVKKPADYLLAGRGLPFWVLTGTITGTCIGTGSLIGGAALAYQHGWAGSAYAIGLGIGTLLTGLFFAGARRYRFMTIIEEVSCYYDGNQLVAQYSNFTLFLSQICWVAVQIKGGAALLGAVTGLDPQLCVLLAAAAKAAISIPGGLKAVVYTDVLQTVILFCGFAFLAHSALDAAGGLTGLRHAMPPGYFSFLGAASLGGWNVVSLILVLSLNPVADPSRRLTMYSARSESAAKWSMVVSGLLVIVFSAAIGIAGMYAFRLNPHLAVPDQSLPWLAAKVLTPWLAALVVVAIVSGMASAANGTAAAAGTFFVRHIFPLLTRHYPVHPVATARWALVLVFAVSTVLALFTGSIVGFVIQFLPLTQSGMALILLVGRFWRRATWQGAVAALIVTPIASVAAMRFLQNPALPAALAGIAALIVVSLSTPRSRRSFEEVAEALSRERQAIEGKSA
ncbi:MAG TPA: sodium:solute symporter family protein [Armatimonadota bacterium]|nr:sodium:solute symporter family protein [Armatimonadota bacterium]